MAEEFRSGQMALAMMASGGMEWPMATEDSFMLRVMFMKANGPMIKLMDKESTLILMEAATKVSGCRISSTAKALSSGQMAQSTPDNTSKE